MRKSGVQLLLHGSVERFEDLKLLLKVVAGKRIKKIWVHAFLIPVVGEFQNPSSAGDYEGVAYVVRYMYIYTVSLK